MQSVHSPIRRQLFEQPVIEAETMSISSVLESAREPMVMPLVTLADTVPMSSPAATSTLIGGAVFLAALNSKTDWTLQNLPTEIVNKNMERFNLHLQPSRL